MGISLEVYGQARQVSKSAQPDPPEAEVATLALLESGPAKLTRLKTFDQGH